MRLIRRVTEPEVITAFLQAEFYEPDFDRDRVQFEQIVMHPDLSNRVENAIRRALLYRRRGHQMREIPPDTVWHEVQIEPEDLKRIRVFPRAHWRRLSKGTFRLENVVEYLRNNPEAAQSDAVIAKIHLLTQRLARERINIPILLIGVDEHSPLTIFEGNHRFTAGCLLDATKVHETFRVICGFSPHMTESCWYHTTAANLWRYVCNRVRHVYDHEADLNAALRGLQKNDAPVERPLASAGATRAELK